MLCAIYRSPKQQQMYLYIEKRDDFSRVPSELLHNFGQPQFAMLLALNKYKKLAIADIEQVRHLLQQQGYYLQLPPPEHPIDRI
ncbi:MAG: YcgL domain-containing protein [Enterobacteriaceae bacterium]